MNKFGNAKHPQAPPKLWGCFVHVKLNNDSINLIELNLLKTIHLTLYEEIE